MSRSPFLLLGLALALPTVEYATGAKSAVGMAPAPGFFSLQGRAGENEPAAVMDMAPMAPPGDLNGVANVGQDPALQQPGAGLKPRVRTMFPETLLWKPEIITDDDGAATLPLDLADSITTWRLSASAVAGDGKLGAMQMPVKVFQDFSSI